MSSIDERTCATNPRFIRRPPAGPAADPAHEKGPENIRSRWPSWKDQRQALVNAGDPRTRIARLIDGANCRSVAGSIPEALSGPKPGCGRVEVRCRSSARRHRAGAADGQPRGFQRLGERPMVRTGGEAVGGGVEDLLFLRIVDLQQLQQ